MASYKTRFLILGGGLAGLSAGFKLKQKNLDFILLEARDRLGGRVWTEKLPGSDLHFELGGEWIGKNHLEIIELARFFKLELIEHTFKVSTFINNYYIKDKPYYYNQVWEKQLNDFLTKIDNLEDLDKLSWEEFLILDGINQHDLVLKNLIDSNDFGEDISQVSARIVVEDYLAASWSHNMDLTVKNGNSTLIAALAKFIGSQNINLNRQVIEVVQTEQGCIVWDNLGNRYETEKIICTLPTYAICKINFSPDIPESQKAALNKLQYGRINKTAVLFNNKFWGEESFELVTDKLPHYIYHSSKRQISNQGILISYATGDKASEMSLFNKSEQEAEIGLILSNIFPAKQITALDSISYYWGNDQYTNGAYAIYKPNQYNLFDILSKSFFNIYFAGEHLAKEQGYMEGAVQSSFNAVMDMLLSF